MIKSYRHNGLKELAEAGTTARINHRFHARLIEILDVLKTATDLRPLNQPSYKLHQLKQYKPVRYSVWVTVQWRVTFEWDRGEASRVDFEQYHGRGAG